MKIFPQELRRKGSKMSGALQSLTYFASALVIVAISDLLQEITLGPEGGVDLSALLPPEMSVEVSPQILALR